jgi:heat shock protein HslJ
MRAILAVLALVLLAACARFAPGAGGSPSPEPSATVPDLAGAWVLRQGSGSDGAIVVPDEYRVTLNFTGDEVGGQACNHYGGRYELGQDGSITFSAMAMTEMACAEPMMTAEAAYHAALAAVRHADRQGDLLTLTGRGAELVFELLPPVPDAEVRGTRWVLESLIHGDAVSSVQGDAWLLLDEDGSLTGSTGCRELSGSYVVSGDQLVPTDLRAEGECTARLEAQDRHVIEVLEGFMATVEGDQLTLTLPNGNGLAYRSTGR